jgi:bifunctional DNase/RNase
MIEVDVVGIVSTELSEEEQAAALADLVRHLEARPGVEPGSMLVEADRTRQAVQLREHAGGRRLEITIGTPEAMAISTGLHGDHLPRPLTHDFIGNLLAALDATPVRVVVTKVDNGTFHGELVVRRGDEELTVDCRPSDGIAVAVRSHIPVLVDDSLDGQFAAA